MTTFEHDGRTFRLELIRDDDHGAPWLEEDGHGPVSDWTRRAKRPGEMVLVKDHHAARYYDFHEAVKIARRDGWDTAPYGQGTKDERAARAAMADFELLRGWCKGDWWYVGVCVNLLDDFGDMIDGADASVWGVESFATVYHLNLGRELANEILAKLIPAAMRA